MSVKQSVNWLSQQRVDIPDLRSIDSSIIFDFKTLIQFFAGNNPYILQGFTIPVSGIGGPATSLQMVVQNSMIWIPGDLNGSFLAVPSGTANEVLNSSNANVVGSFSAGTNYIGIQFNRATDPSTSDLVNFWDVDSDSEFAQTVPRGLVMNYQIVISNSGFANTCPVAIVTVSGSNVTSIENAKYSPWRLGQGGTNPDPNYNSPNVNNTVENPLLATSNSSPDPFANGDWNMKVFKDWADAVMTLLKTMNNSAYWYISSTIPGSNLVDLFMDTAGSVVTGAGTFIHAANTPGLLTWTSQINIRGTVSPLTYIIPAGSAELLDQQVAYIELVRNQDFQPANTFTFLNGSTTVNSTLTVTGIAAGDWIKYNADAVNAWAQVESVLGSTITLTEAYTGQSASGKALRSQGSYTMQVAYVYDTPALSSSNTYWLARRDDNAVPNSIIAAPGASGATRTSNEATITTTAAHNLSVGQGISITLVSDPTFDVITNIDSVPSATTFTYGNAGANVAAGTTGNGTVAVQAVIYLRALGQLTQGDDRPIDDTTVLNILKYIGSPSESSTTPPYTIVPSNLCPYSYSSATNLTQSISAVQGNVNALYQQLVDPSYDEPLVVISEVPQDTNHVQGPVLSGATLTLPVSSRNGFAPQYYTVGKGYLQVYLNGQMLNANNAYSSQPISFFNYNVGTGTPTQELFTPVTAWAVQYTPTINVNLTELQFTLVTDGTPIGNLIGEVYSNSASLPGTLLGTSSNTAANLVTATPGIITLNFGTPVALTSGTPYWFVLTGDSTYQTNVAINTVTMCSTGSSWPVASLNGTWSSSATATPTFQLVGTTTGPADGAITNGWSEVGSPGAPSNQITIQRGLSINDVVTFRIGVLGGPGNGSGGGGISAGTNIGSGSYVYYGISGSNLVFKSIAAGANVTVVDNGSGTITISSTGGGSSSVQIVGPLTTNTLLTTLQYGLVLVNASSGPVTITLPASGAAGLIYYITKTDSSANAVTISGNGNLFSFTASSLTLASQGDEYSLVGNGQSNGWSII